MQSVTGVAPSPEWAKATAEQISRDRDGRWEGKREREIVCECERKRRRRAVKTEEVKCRLVHHSFVKDLKQNNTVTVGHLTQSTRFSVS